MTQTVQQPIFDPKALEGFEGKWVAIRDGVVVASAESLEDLRANDEVRREDAVYVVPEAASYFF